MSDEKSSELTTDSITVKNKIESSFPRKLEEGKTSLIKKIILFLENANQPPKICNIRLCPFFYLVFQLNYKECIKDTESCSKGTFIYLKDA